VTICSNPSDLTDGRFAPWQQRAAHHAPKAPALRSRIATLARPGAPVASSIKQLVISGAELVVRRPDGTGSTLPSSVVDGHRPGAQYS
jgi:hypothetical protein